MGLGPNQFQGGNRGQNFGNQGGYQQRNPNHQNNGNRGGHRGGRGGRGGNGGNRNQSQRTNSQNGQQQQLQAVLPLPLVNIKDLEELKTADERKNFVGNLIYPIVATLNADLAGRITGMLIDEKLVNFKDLLTNQQYFNNKCREAQALLVNALQSQQVPVQVQQQ